MSVLNNSENGSNGSTEEDHIHIVDHEGDDDILVDAIRYINIFGEYNSFRE